jgi:alpha-ribazole phosphatase
MEESFTVEPREIYLARHVALRPQGEGKRYIGQLEVPLSTEGIRQAEALRERFRRVPLSAIFCSDLERSVRTAAIIGEPHGLQPQARRDLREIALGSWEGLAFEEVRHQYPQEYEARGQNLVRFRPPGGESFLDLANRVIPALFDLLHSSKESILILGHAGVNRILLSLMMGKSLEKLFDIKQDYGGLSTILYQDSMFEVRRCNETQP